MNIRKLFTTLCVCLPLGLAAQQYAGNYKLYASYDFEKDGNDLRGNTSLTLGGGAAITDDAARGKVLTFDGTQSQYAVMTPAPVVGDSLSLSFWFKRSSSDDNGLWKHIFEFYNAEDESNIFLMPIYGYDEGKSGFVCDTRSFSTGIWEAMTGDKLHNDDQWRHVVITVAGTEWSYYINGVLQAKKSIFGALSVQAPTALYFGMNPERDDRVLSCSMDDINIYHYPLSESQVKQAYRGETITEPTYDTPITFHFDGDLKESEDRIQVSGTGYALDKDANRGDVVTLNAGGQLNFSESIIPESASTLNFLYKKDAFADTDNGKYIYQSTNAEGIGYGVKLNVADGVAKLELEAMSNGNMKTAVGKHALTAGRWNAIAIVHQVGNESTKGTMRLYIVNEGQKVVQTAGLAQVETFVLQPDKWSLGSTTAAQTAGGCYDELIVEKKSLSTNEISSFYSSNLTSVDITVDYADTYQTIRNIGASDAWNAQRIGLYWPEAKKSRLAELLFSKEFDEEGNPKGIGLSCWRFNIGAGSAEQGDDSKINQEDRRSECFLNADGTYNWDKQKGQQWFLEKAMKEYEVEDLVGFMNSPPVHYTKHGYAFNKDNGWNYILADDKYDDFARFTADIIEHFEAEGIHFDYISPINEPQHQWGADGNGENGQEGTPATVSEMARVVKAMSTEFSGRGLTTQLFTGEAGSIEGILPQIPELWGGSGANNIKGLPNVAGVVSSHSYWHDGSAKDIHDWHVKLKDKIRETDPSLEYFQTEYSLLGEGYKWGHPGATSGNFSEIECAMSVARVLHADFVIANATGWHWWTTFELGSHGGESRFALIEALTKQDLTDGIYNDTKLLYALGNYSRFVRPGMKRTGVKRSDNRTEEEALSEQMYSAYIDEAGKQVVIVATNTTAVESTIRLNVENLPEGMEHLRFTPYITSGEHDLKVQAKVDAGTAYKLPALSIVTFVSEKADTPPNSIDETEEATLSVYPNPTTDKVTVSCEDGVRRISLYDMYGKLLKQVVSAGEKTVEVPLTDLQNGIYVLHVNTEKGILTQKLMKN